jgi:FG-GAP-like repeat
VLRFASFAAILVIGCQSAGPPAPPTSPPPAPPTTPPTPVASQPIAVGACGTQQAFTLGPAIDYPPPPGASGALAVGFLNKDAPIDLIVGGTDDRGVATLGVMLGNGDATFKPPIAYELLAGAEARSIALTDFDTDEDLDVVSAGGSGPPEMFLNNGDGTFGAAVALPPGPNEQHAGHAVTVQVADIHGDAHPDVVTYSGGSFDVWHDKGHATFVASTLPPVEGLDHGAGLALADTDRNGSTDIAVAGTDHGKATIVVMLGKHGVFAPPMRYATPATGDATAIVAADFDGDGKIDLAASFVGSLAIIHGKGDGTFGAATILPVADAVEGAALLAADLDGDNRADLIVTTRGGLAVYRANASGFDAPVVLPGADLGQVVAGDFRGEHVLGLATTRKDGHAMIWPAACH